MTVNCVNLTATCQPEVLDAAYRRVMQSGRFILGDQVASFEAAWAEWCGVGYCVACASGFDALRLLLMAADIGPGSEVLVSAFTCPPTFLAIQATGASAVPVETNPNTMLLDLAVVEHAITPRTRAILPVHLYGLMPDMDALMRLARKHSLVVIEDACQAHGAQWRLCPPGSWSAGAAYSFYPTKNLGAYGDAGAVVTSDAALAERVRQLRNYGSLGAFNSRMDELQAAFLLAKLPGLGAANGWRNDCAELYRRQLQDVPGLTLPQALPYCMPSWHQYVVRHARRNELRAWLAENGTGTLIHYPVAPHRTLHLSCELPVTDWLCDTVLSLPMGAHVSQADVIDITNQIKRFAERTN